jgi:taurine dioxygenase
MIEICRMGPQIGAAISGIDIRTLDDDGFRPVYQAWLDYNVIVVKDQDLTLEQFVAYSRRFGVVTPHPSKSTRHPDMAEVTLMGVNKFNPDGSINDAIYRRGAEGWHTDGAYDPIPFKATQLYGLAIPNQGGDTFFASGYAAYEAMPQRLKNRLDGVNGAFTYGGRKGRQALLNPEDRDRAPAMHPIIRTHPETRRKSMYFDPGKILYIEGASQQESDDIIDELTALMIQPDGEYRHKWSVGDVVIWDNRCSYHKAAGDYPPEQDRIHWRTSIQDWPRA